MVSAFRALNEMVQSRQGSGLVMDWKQSTGMLLVGGDSRVIKVWDAQTETQGLVCLHKVIVTSSSCFVVGPGNQL
jgi:regulator-associated protein of mTOR